MQNRQEAAAAAFGAQYTTRSVQPRVQLLQEDSNGERPWWEKPVACYSTEKWHLYWPSHAFTVHWTPDDVPDEMMTYIVLLLYKIQETDIGVKP